MAKWQTIIIEKIWFIGAIIIEFLDDLLDDLGELISAGAWWALDLSGNIIAGYDKIADLVSWAISFFGVTILRRVHQLRMETLKYKRQLRGGALYFIFTAVVIVYCIASAVDYSYAYNGRTLGIVKEQRDVLGILDMISEELTQEYKSPIAIDGDEDITFTPVISYGKEIDEADAVLKKFTYMGDIQTKGYGIMVDGIKIATVQSENVGKDILDSVISKYVKKRGKYEYVGIEENVSIEETDTTLAKITSKSGVLKIIDRGTVKTSTCLTEAGDTLESVAKKLEVSEHDIRRLNVDLVYDDDNNLVEGQTVIAEKEAPVLTVKTVGKEVFAETIKFETETVESDNYYKGEEFVQTEGKDGKQKVTARVTRINGELTEREDLETEVIQEVVNKVIVKGTKEKPKTVGTGTFIKPVNAAITWGFGMRWGRMHEGVDMPCSTGTPVHASDGGTVKVAGWYYGYGLCVIIDHGGGMSTLYGHNSSLNVSVGDKVFQGQVIARVGSTGRSTGPHCHFEVHINGKAVDPKKYL